MHEIIRQLKREGSTPKPGDLRSWDRREDRLGSSWVSLRKWTASKDLNEQERTEQRGQRLQGKRKGVHFIAQRLKRGIGRNQGEEIGKGQGQATWRNVVILRMISHKRIKSWSNLTLIPLDIVCGMDCKGTRFMRELRVSSNSPARISLLSRM